MHGHMNVKLHVVFDSTFTNICDKDLELQLNSDIWGFDNSTAHVKLLSSDKVMELQQPLHFRDRLSHCL